jgi:hypothetical protein
LIIGQELTMTTTPQEPGENPDVPHDPDVDPDAPLDPGNEPGHAENPD